MSPSCKEWGQSLRCTIALLLTVLGVAGMGVCCNRSAVRTHWRRPTWVILWSVVLTRQRPNNSHLHWPRRKLATRRPTLWSVLLTCNCLLFISTTSRVAYRQKVCARLLCSSSHLSLQQILQWWVEF